MFGTRIITVVSIFAGSLLGAPDWAAAGPLKGSAPDDTAAAENGGDGASGMQGRGEAAGQRRDGAANDTVSIAGAPPGTKAGPATDAGGPQFSAYAKPNYEWQGRPSTTIGFKDFGGVTRVPIELDNFSSDPGIEAGFRVDFPWAMRLGNVRLGKSWGIDLNVTYFGSNSKHDIGQLPAAGENFGLYGPFAGGGVTTGQDLNNVVLNNDFSRTTGEIRLRKNYDLWGADMRTYVGFCFGGVEVDDDLDLMVGNNIDYRSRIKMDNFYYGPTGGFLVNLPMPALDLGNSKYVFYFGGYGQVMFNDADIKRQVDLSGAVNLSGADKFSHSETTLGGGVKIGGRYEFNRFSVHWGGEFAINENVPEQHVDPNTGDATARFGVARDYKISVGAKYTF
jgi:hypothetical protein